jgi:hypothetical protein
MSRKKAAKKPQDFVNQTLLGWNRGKSIMVEANNRRKRGR